jgi:acyl-CoA thioesterase
MLRLEELGPDQFRAQNLPDTSGVVFGGQLLAQAVAATARSVPDRAVKSMHTIFARGGSPDQPLRLEVEQLHRGRTFVSAEVSASQGDRLCTRSLLLLDQPDDDFIVYSELPPRVAPPEECPPGLAVREGWEVRIVDGVNVSDPMATGPPELAVWSRFAEVPTDPWASQALLAFASDGFLVGTAMRPHHGVGLALAHVSVSTSVITQTLTFHSDFNASEWLLLVHHSPVAGRGRSFGRADVFTREGQLVASYAQENMIRAFSDDRRPAPGERSKY